MTGSIDVALGRFMVVLIRGYQRHLSPRKGYSCAHRVKHGGESCSEFARNIFAHEGWRAGLGSLQARFVACHAASRSLNADRLNQRLYDEDFDIPLGVESKDPAKSGPEQEESACRGDQETAECCCWCGAEFCAKITV
ncbi:membrane protein insertion efficiency factor YidD [Paludisphaera borealis]|uniref:Membrane protein insertion efficiency factor n=1 Tax=Paludisphaera borealis TaxID=1387353 RepID=A0A1U7CJS0_9BACT|nr:Putative membrane protein insertion efficiency factor [Paludisphaera borealis]